MRIALGQIDMGFENKEAAMALCSQLMAEAKEKAVDFVIFPEMTLTGFTLAPETYGENRANSPSINFFKEEAKKNGVAVCFGLPVYENGVATNHCIYLDENGEEAAFDPENMPEGFDPSQMGGRGQRPDGKGRELPEGFDPGSMTPPRGL